MNSPDSSFYLQISNENEVEDIVGNILRFAQGRFVFSLFVTSVVFISSSFDGMRWAEPGPSTQVAPMMDVPFEQGILTHERSVVQTP